MEKVKNIDFGCPKCSSFNIRRQIYVPISRYGHLPKPPVDYCDECGFKSEVSFSILNIKLNRDTKLKEILNGI